jgi:hypothetical protein
MLSRLPLSPAYDSSLVGRIEILNKRLDIMRELLDVLNTQLDNCESPRWGSTAVLSKPDKKASPRGSH